MFYGQCWKCGERWGLGTTPTCVCPEETTKPLRKWAGLTDSEIGIIAYNVNPLDGIRQFSRAIEAKLKEKNT